jgi:hypothetical protein
MKTDSFNLAGFSSISLEDLNKVKLRDRQDTKFVFNQNILPLLLDKLNPFYQVLEINGMQTFVYDNTYFDSDDFLFYKQHHNENRKRFKVRYRKYSSNIGLYFEIKTKNNKDRTIKKRLLVNERNGSLGEPERRLVSKIIGLPPDQLTPKLELEFSRITLTDYSFNERLTIDTNLSAKNGTYSKIFDQLVISEVKQKKYNPRSDFIRTMRNLKIPEMRISKYCMGILHVYKGIKYNRFKPKLLRINKILTQE